ncbi:hypothetical protein Tco_1041244 [Tanacetum coccineum]|uniref:ABC transmembrane type-1 domain-containing protein n=1 Tax=Tanacetum coccineum TaxID=301880 RepID=A0ABQ5GGM9_9ASTR
MHLEKIHVTWAHFRKKRDKIAALHKEAQRFHMVAGDCVTKLCNGIRICKRLRQDFERALQVMDTGCRMFLVAGPLFLQFLGSSFTHGTVSSIPIVGSISPEGFLPSILLLVVIIVTVVIVAGILVVVVVTIVGVVIVVAIIGVVVVVVGGVSFIIKLSFVIIGSLLRIVFCYLIH